jgi:hypothetical protein
MSLVFLNDRAVRSATAFGSLNTGSMVFIKKLTASSSATLSFVDGASSVVLDSTYKEYLFTFKNIHAATDGAEFQFNLSADSGSNYNVTKTTTMFYGYQTESGSSTGLSYDANLDLAQSSSDQIIMENLGNGNDENGSGYLQLFNPSSTTFVKHFMSRGMRNGSADYCVDYYMAGYGNTTSAVDAIQFKMSSGNIDAGDICLYGIL